MAQVTANLLYEICKHCNNWFNKGNVPPTAPFFEHTSEYMPPSFLELAGRIAKFIVEVEKDNITSETVGAHSESIDLNHSAWQVAFKRELSIYKRAKFL